MKPLLSEDALREGVARMALRIGEAYGDRPLTIVGIMTGSLILLADLIRRLRMPLRVGLVQTSSYREGTSRGALRINAEWMLDIRGRDVLLVDDIFDTGHTLVEVMRRMDAFEPASLRSAVLLRKQDRCEVDRQPDFVGFDIPDRFVVGYGLDYRDQYRNLPFVAELESSDLSAGGGPSSSCASR
ncbi:MAG: hypoxanthine phosphoribosyltransferase [Planctomycetes bacterium]|nr:hypoxanthine phosphoribosyltransferase [Planctomycetota bacterium]